MAHLYKLAFCGTTCHNERMSLLRNTKKEIARMASSIEIGFAGVDVSFYLFIDNGKEIKRMPREYVKSDFVGFFFDLSLFFNKRLERLIEFLVTLFLLMIIERRVNRIRNIYYHHHDCIAHFID